MREEFRHEKNGAHQLLPQTADPDPGFSKSLRALNPNLAAGQAEETAMRVGVPREIKVHEYRVGLVPAGVRELTTAGHEVLVESGAGTGIGVDDAQCRAAGAAIAAQAGEVFERADLVIKVKEPQPAECEMLRQGPVLFTYLHLAADPVQARGLMKSGA